MPLRSEKRSTASLAGWLFADLSIVLMILFASTGLMADDLRCEKQDETSINSPCKKVPASTSTIVPDKGNGNVRPKPIVMIVNNARSMSTSTFQLRIEREIQKQAQADSSLQGASDWDFGVILIYGGGRGNDTTSGVNVAKDVQRKFSVDSQNRWKKVRVTTFYETGFTNELGYGSVKLKLFPIITK
jgi:hypothetical protein